MRARRGAGDHGTRLSRSELGHADVAEGRSELVTTGPYAFVRHPIYTGIFLAMLGSTIGLSIFWLLPLFLVGGYFIHCARQEEKLLLAQFPERYPAYKRRTKMFLPFVL